jgi:hypothetical protein
MAKSLIYFKYKADYGIYIFYGWGFYASSRYSKKTRMSNLQERADSD